jgi:hypothetical protein
MGKVKRVRAKLHLKAAQVPSPDGDDDRLLKIPEPVARLTGGDEGSIFPTMNFKEFTATKSGAASVAGLSLASSKGRRKEFDARSIITSLSQAEGRLLSKKEKRQIKHETFMHSK